MLPGAAKAVPLCDGRKTINNNAKYYYKIIKGISKIKGGIAILKNLEYPDSVINNAIEIMNKL